jgi:hypothetical protein
MAHRETTSLGPAASVPGPETFDGSAARKLETTLPPGPDLHLAPAERRRSDREAAIGLDGWISSPSGRSQTSGRTIRVRDLSLHGAGFIASKPFRVGADHWMLVSRGPMRMSTRIRIASCQPRDDGSFDVGGEFY